jgi:hypothetical protein
LPAADSRGGGPQVSLLALARSGSSSGPPGAWPALEPGSGSEGSSLAAPPPQPLEPGILRGLNMLLVCCFALAVDKI